MVWSPMRFLVGVTLFLCVESQIYYLWPKPQSLDSDTELYSIDPKSFSFQVTCSSTPILLQAFTRYQSLTFGDGTCSPSQTPISQKSNSSLVALMVCVHSASESLQFGVDESYQLNITSGPSMLTANTVFGALRGLETFSQLVECSSTQYFIRDGPIQISDAPRFPWRGLLIDTSRHYLPVQTILNTIAALSYVKMNTLHWHAVDAQSFPMESNALPNITLGAWRSDLVYSHADISNIVSVGKSYGVRVVVEFDTPGHAASWGVGYPALTVTDCPSYTHNINNIPLNPVLPATYTQLQAFFQEMAGLFPDNYMHFGGDEVVYGCWGQDASVTAFMNKHSFTYDQLLNYYFTTLWQPLAVWNKSPVVWQEVFLAYVTLPQNAIVHIWQAPSGGVTVADVVSAGQRGLVSPGWYLDHLDQTWIDMYAIEPLSNCSAATTGSCFNITNPAEVQRVLGGEAAMWGEQVDQTNFESRVWPRTAAVAERLWSAASVQDPNSALPRLLAQRCRMVRRGVNAAPLQPGFC